MNRERRSAETTSARTVLSIALWRYFICAAVFVFPVHAFCDDALDTACARARSRGSVETVVRERFSGRRIIQAYDFASRAWYTIGEGKVFGLDPQGIPFHGAQRVGGVQNSPPGGTTDASNAVRQIPILGIMQVCARPEIIRERVPLPDGGCRVTVELFESSYFPRKALHPDLVITRRDSIELDPRGFVRSIQSGDAPGAFTYDPPDPDDPNAPPFERFRGFGGTIDVLSVRWEPNGAPRWFTKQGVEARAIELDTASDLDPRRKGMPVAEAILKAPAIVPPGTAPARISASVWLAWGGGVLTAAGLGLWWWKRRGGV